MSKSQPNHRIETQTVHLGNHGDATTGAVIPSIVMATTFERQPDYSAPSGFHDDGVMATCIAYYSLKSNKNSGIYNVR